jgi:hypothetical protein
MIIFVFFNFLAFWPFPWQRQPFWKNQPLKAQLHMAYDIPTRFHKVWSRHLREIERTKMCGRIIIVKKKQNINTSPDEVRGDVIKSIMSLWLVIFLKVFFVLKVNIYPQHEYKTCIFVIFCVQLVSQHH